MDNELSLENLAAAHLTNVAARIRELKAELAGLEKVLEEGQQLLNSDDE